MMMLLLKKVKNEGEGEIEGKGEWGWDDQVVWVNGFCASFEKVKAEP